MEDEKRYTKRNQKRRKKSSILYRVLRPPWFLTGGSFCMKPQNSSSLKLIQGLDVLPMWE